MEAANKYDMQWKCRLPIFYRTVTSITESLSSNIFYIQYWISAKNIKSMLSSFKSVTYISMLGYFSIYNKPNLQTY